MMSNFFGKDCLLVAEVAQAHDGSLGTAHAFIDAAADAGANAVKFQTHIAAAESTRDEPWRVAFSPQDETRYDYWKRMEFSADQWAGLKAHADEKEILFLSSPFSFAAVELLERVGVAAWKVASGEMFEEAFLARLAATGLPVMLSTGMCAWTDIDCAVGVMRERETEFALLQCTTAYPCPPDGWGLNLLEEYRERYDCPVGLSDHSGTVFPGLLAAWSGAAVVEVHLALSRFSFGPDVAASLVPEQLRQLADGIRAVERARRHPVAKDVAAAEQEDNRRRFTKSVALVRSMPAGTTLRREDLTLKKPGDGIPSSRIDALVGAVLAVDVSADVLLRFEHLVGGAFE